jgi:hypothetical protein
MESEDNRSLEVRAVAAAFFSAASIAVILRCYVRGWVVKAFGWDDAVMVLAHVGSGPAVRCCTAMRY